MMRYLGFGLVFGFILSRVGATDFDAIAEMFLLRDLHLAGVIGVAIAVAAPVLYLLRRQGIAGPNGPITIKPKPLKPGTVVGGVLFGAGWAITGTCPGTVLAQIGEGKLLALFTFAGIVLGTALYRSVGASVEAWLASRREPPQPAAPREAHAG